MNKCFNCGKRVDESIETNGYCRDCFNKKTSDGLKSLVGDC